MLFSFMSCQIILKNLRLRQFGSLFYKFLHLNYKKIIMLKLKVKGLKFNTRTTRGKIYLFIFFNFVNKDMT